MRFHPSEEQLAIQDSLRGTLADTLPMERLRQLLDAPLAIDPASWDALMALGLAGLALPEAVGGSGLGLVDLALAIEVLGQGACVGPVIQHLVAGLAILHGDSEAARSAWLGPIAAGSAVATLAWGGDVPEDWSLIYHDGKVSGEVAFVPGASAAQLFVTGITGGGLALAELDATINVSDVAGSDATRKLGTVRFAATPATLLLPQGSKAVARIFDAALVLCAADALGGAQHCTDLSVAYAKDREQFGQPIGRFQALKHQLVNMALEVEPARALLWYAAYAQDAALPDARRAAAMAKAHMTDRFVSVTRAAIAAHGGIGYTWEYGLGVWFRRALFDRAYLGSPSLHRARAADLGGW